MQEWMQLLFDPAFPDLREVLLDASSAGVEYAALAAAHGQGHVEAFDAAAKVRATEAVLAILSRRREALTAYHL